MAVTVFAIGLAQVSLLVALLQEAAPPVTAPDSSPFGNINGTVQMQIVILIATVAGFIFQYVMHRSKVAEDRRKDEVRMAEEKQRRKWDIEDRMHAREEAIKRMQLVHTKINEVKEEAQGAARKVEERSDHLAQKLEENTEISRQAFNEANNFNGKIDAIIKQFQAGASELELKQTTIRAVPTGDEDARSSDPTSSDSK